MTLGEVIAEFRTATGLSMEQFGKLAGMSKGYISMLEHNKTSRGDEPSPTFEKYLGVAKAMNIDVEQLIRRVNGRISLEPSFPDDISTDGLEVARAYDQADSGIQASVRKLLKLEQEDDTTFILTSAAHGGGLRQTELTTKDVNAARRAAAKLRQQHKKK